uniref:non-specific serine/threonine protein kinase n=1 Tax=Leersia perrieri TaxID=77586 RepID=A0A0D9UWI0_9ORYZ
MHPTLLILPFLASLLLPFCHAECEPSTCGDITVRYPFWLGGPNLSRSSSSSSSPAASCGHPAFEVWCTSGVASLRGSQILVLTIDYTNSSFIAAHKRVADGGDGVCRTDFNISSSLALSPFTISGRNRAICFLYGCSNGSTVRITEPGIVNATSVCTRPIYAHLGGSYDRDRPPAIETTGNCTFSYLPVLWPDAPASLTPGVNYSPSKSPLGFQCILLLPTLSLILSAATAAEAQACKVGTCGDMRILEPFGLVTDQADNTSCRWYGFQVTCNNSIPYLGYYRRNQPFRFRIVDIFYNNNSLLVIDTHKTDDFTNASDCHVPSVNTSYKIGLPFSINDVNQKLVFYNCSKALAPAERSELGLFETKCRNNTFARLVGRYDDDESGYALDSCYAVIVPVLGREGKAKVSNYEKLISGGFLLSWQPPHQPGTKMKTTTKLAIGLGAGGGTFMIIFIFILAWNKFKKRKQSRDLKDLMRSTSSMQSYSKDLELGGSPHIFTYEELEEATAGFSASRELGDGGFGTVYKGKLRDGRVVAVKRLYKNNYRRVEQFLNEVDILSRLLHQNLVTLYGCTSRVSRDLLLVYEYIPNGTVADHLHGPRAAEQGLTWPVRMTIAIETAEALAYLHAVEIIHRDVKTNNILLDDAFHVKVADFGLSRLFPLEVTHVSTVPQGTPGYVDPVYHQCYKLTDKSDVYSFGVVLVELISSKPAVDMSRSHSDINLASMALNRIQNHEVDQLVDPELGYETDSETKRMVDLVAELAFQCLQMDRDNRPRIKEVVEVLHCIKDGECPAKKMNKDASPKEDSHLLRDSSIQYSPDSVIHRFHSQSTNHSVASNSSG